MLIKNKSYINLLGWLLIISIALNIYQFGISHSAKKFKRKVSHRKLKFILSSSKQISKSLEDFIELASNPNEKEDEDRSRLFSMWNGVYSSSKELEFKLKTINTSSFKPIAGKIQNIQQIVGIVNKNLYSLNREFLNKNPQFFALTGEEKEKLAAISDIYNFLGEGIKIEHDVVFESDLFNLIKKPLKKIDDTGVWKLLK